MVGFKKSTSSSAAAMLMLASTFTSSFVNANEMDLPGAGGFLSPRAAAQIKPWKRASSKTYKQVHDYSGSDFFDSWQFFNWDDPTHGMVNYQGAGDAWNKGLVSIDSDGRAIMKVDDSTWLSEGSNRDSIRITSNTPFTKGQLLVLDAQHMPYGCGTWPAFWTVGANWPAGGEIDIVEGVNNQKRNQMTLHTNPGCEIQKTSDFAGNILQESCDAYYNSNTGCGIQDPSTKTYGKGFNNIGGGVFATLWTDDGISIWFFARGNIPSDLSSRSPRPSSWGRPRAFFSSADCTMDSFFGPQTIVFDTTLCGDWGGSVYQSNGCPGTCSQRVTNPNNFLDAYWAINYVRVFQ